MKEIHQGIIVDETVLFSLEELCETCGVKMDFVITVVEYGLLEPFGDLPDQWRFSSTALHRLQKAIRLQKDLEVNIAGAALVLDLLDEVHWLRSRLSLLDQENEHI